MSATGATAFRVGISEPVNTVLAIWMAEAAGLYAAEGLAVDIVNMSGGSRGAAELAAGRIDAMHVGLSSVVRLNRAGGDLRIIAALANVIRFTFFSAPAVRTAADLRGGVVGITTFGSESDALMTLLLQRLGLTRADVTLKECGGGASRLAALQAGEIRATALNEPVASMARVQGLHVLVDLVPERIPWLFTGIVVQRSAIEQRRDLLARFIRATAEGNRRALAEPARAKAVLAQRTGIADSRIIDIGYDDFSQLSPPDIAPTAAAAENVLAQLGVVGAPLDDFIDGRILDSLNTRALQQNATR